MPLNLKDICIGIIEEKHDDYIIKRFELFQKVIEYKNNNKKFVIYKDDEEYYYINCNKKYYELKNKYINDLNMKEVVKVKSIYDILNTVALIIKNSDYPKEIKENCIYYESVIKDYDINPKRISYQEVSDNFDVFVENYILAFGDPLNNEFKENDFTLIRGKRK